MPTITTSIDGKLLADHLPREFHATQLAEMQNLLAQLHRREIKPSIIVGSGYGNKTREIALEWLNHVIGSAQKNIDDLDAYTGTAAI